MNETKREQYKRAWRKARQRHSLFDAIHEVPRYSYAWRVLDEQLDLFYTTMTDLDRVADEHLLSIRLANFVITEEGANLNRRINVRPCGHFARLARHRKRTGFRIERRNPYDEDFHPFGR